MYVKISDFVEKRDLKCNGGGAKQEAQLPQRNSTSPAHVYLGWLTDMQCTEHHRIAEVVLFF